jgi:hypothetical protein
MAPPPPAGGNFDKVRVAVEAAMPQCQEPQLAVFELSVKFP